MGDKRDNKGQCGRWIGEGGKSNLISRLWIAISVLINITNFVNAQMPFKDTGYEGFTHYVTYDDLDEAIPKAPNPYDSIKGHERFWDEEVMYIPELVLEDPFPRNNTSSAPTSMGPCGNTKRGLVYYSAFPGRSNLIRWKVVHPIVEGNCTIRLSNGVDEKDDKNFEILQPVFDFSYQRTDGSYDYFSGEIGNYYRKVYPDGSFTCGRADPGTFESITVLFPNMTCDECTFQMVVETKQGKIYQCADIEVINSEMQDCIGMCLNEGVCVNGK